MAGRNVEAHRIRPGPDSAVPQMWPGEAAKGGDASSAARDDEDNPSTPLPMAFLSTSARDVIPRTCFVQDLTKEYSMKGPTVTVSRWLGAAALSLGLTLPTVGISHAARVAHPAAASATLQLANDKPTW